MASADGPSELQQLQVAINRANNVRLPLEGDFHVSPTIDDEIHSTIRCPTIERHLHARLQRQQSKAAASVVPRMFPQHLNADTFACLAVLQQLQELQRASSTMSAQHRIHAADNAGMLHARGLQYRSGTSSLF